jgi:hypothetical protein
MLTTLTDVDTTFANIVSGGHSVCYKSKTNGSGSGTYSLPGGGQLKPCN